MPSVNNVVLHDINTGVIFRMIQESDPISRSEIAEKTTLAPSTVSVITGELMEQGLIRECGRATSTGGRRRILLEINPAGGYFICVDLGGEVLRIGVLDLSLDAVQTWSHPLASRNGEDLYQFLKTQFELSWTGARMNTSTCWALV